MAEDFEESAQAEAGGGRSRRKNLIMVGILVGVMVIEGAGVFILAKHFGARPASAEAGGIDGLDPEEGQKAPKEIEVEVARFRAQNDQARQTAVYELTVYAVVLETDQEAFASMIEQKKATIQDRFSSIIRAADPQVLNEPDPATLRQSFERELSQIAEEEEMVRRVLIPSIVAYREN